MTEPQSGIQRQHELDALRAFAMLLGIALHGCLAYTGFPWIVRDLKSGSGFEIFFCAIHGFRMALFMLVSALLVALPLALLTHGENDVVALPWNLSDNAHIEISGLFQVLYVWTMSFGLMVFFRTHLNRETGTIRYLSDSAYWLYLAHLPLIVLLQVWVRPWDVPAFIKFFVVCVLTTLILLATYQYLVRYTWVGRLLNGPRKRLQMQPESPSSPSAVTAP